MSLKVSSNSLTEKDFPFQDIFGEPRKNYNYFKNDINFFMIQLSLNKNYYVITKCLI